MKVVSGGELAISSWLDNRDMDGFVRVDSDCALISRRLCGVFWMLLQSSDSAAMLAVQCAISSSSFEGLVSESDFSGDQEFRNLS